jgi:catechol 2,3-dioxygenase-like lactoylglutathione lyase family enzyme
MTPRSLDHLVLPVRDLAAAAQRYRDLGFSVGARNRHPWGTENHIVQFQNTFLEPITFGAGAEMPPLVPGKFAFSAFIADFMARHGDGFAMLALESQDAAGAKAEFDQAGFGGFDTFFFERKGKRPDGAEMTVSFSLAYAATKDVPDAGFFVCQQHNPDNFWNPAFQVHPNGARNVVSVVMVAENPSDHHILLSAFTGVRGLTSNSTGVSVTLPRGALEIITPVAFERHFGADARLKGIVSPRFMGYRIETADVDAAWHHARAFGAVRRDGTVVVPASGACGTAIAFVGADNQDSAA